MECRKILSPSGLAIETGSTIAPSGSVRLQVAQLAVDPYGHDRAVVAEEIESGGGRVRHSLLADAVCCDRDGHAGHNRFLPLRWLPGRPRVSLDLRLRRLDGVVRRAWHDCGRRCDR